MPTLLMSKPFAGRLGVNTRGEQVRCVSVPQVVEARMRGSPFDVMMRTHS